MPTETGSGNAPYVSLSLAELAVLREEIKSRSGYQHAFINLAITGTGVIAGIAVSQPDSRVLLLIPLVSAALGLLWIDHHIVIQTIGQTIAAVKKTFAARISMPQLLDQSGNTIPDTILDTENSIPSGGSRWGFLLRFAIHPCIIFGIIPCLLLAYAVAELTPIARQGGRCLELFLATGIDLALLILFFSYWWTACVRPRMQPQV